MKVRNMALCAFFAALLTLCAWLSIPTGDAALTLQTFAVALCLLLLGGKRGCLAILVYLMLGAVGLPVFTGFRGGIGTLLNVTGGYLLGFLAWALVYWLITAVKGHRAVAMLLGLLTCYIFGSAWFYWLYLRVGSALGLGLILLKCVVPYLLPDALKLGLAFLLASRLKRFV